MSEVSEKAEDPLGLWFNPATCRMIQRGGATYRKIQGDKRRREAGVAPAQVGEGGGVRKKHQKVSEPTRPPSTSLQEEDEEAEDEDEEEEEEEEAFDVQEEEEVMTIRPAMTPVAQRVYEPMRSVSATHGKEFNLRRALVAAASGPAEQHPQTEPFRMMPRLKQLTKPRTPSPSISNGVSPADRLRKERFWRGMNRDINNNQGR